MRSLKSLIEDCRRTLRAIGSNVSRPGAELARAELKLYGSSATAAEPNKRIWISTPPTNIWTGMTTTPFAATLRDKENYVDLTGMAQVRWITRASGFHVVHPADGILGRHPEFSRRNCLATPEFGVRPCNS